MFRFTQKISRGCEIQILPGVLSTLATTIKTFPNGCIQDYSFISDIFKTINKKTFFQFTIHEELILMPKFSKHLMVCRVLLLHLRLAYAQLTQVPILLYNLSLP